MKIVEKILAIGILTGLILKLSLISGGDTLILWSTLLLACLYYPLGFLFFNQIRLRHVFEKDAYKDVSALDVILAIVTGIGLSIICVGALFKLLSLTGADQMLIVRLAINVIIFSISMLLFLKKRGITSKPIIWRTSIAMVIALILFLTSELSIVRLHYRNHPDYIRAYEKYLDDPKNEVLIREKEKEYYRIILTEEEFNLYENSGVNN
jgi:hypothetical protein